MAHPRSLYLFVAVVCIALLGSLSFSTPRQSVAHFGQQFATNIVSLASAASSCPNPQTSTTNPPASIASTAESLPSSAECKTLPTVSKDFTVSACHHDSYCNALDLVITRTDRSHCAAVENKMRDDPVSNNTQLTDFVRKSLGPDGFMVVTDGSERMARFQPDVYLGDCSYRFNLRFNNAGPVSLQIWHHFEDYFLYWENNMEWPVMATENVLLQRPLFLDVCTACRSHVASPSHANATFFVQPAPLRFECSDERPVYGSYIPASYLDAHNPSAFYDPLPANQNAYRFVPSSDCRFSHAGLRYADHGACFLAPQQNVLFTGDSHMRVIFDGISHRLSGYQWTMTESEKSGHKNASFPNRYLDFHWDPFGNTDAECDDEFAAFDVFAFSLGHHLHRFSTQEYTEHMQKVFEHLTQLSISCPTKSGRTRRLVYVTPPAVAPREDHFVQEIKDRRTNLRIAHWARIGLDIADKYGWRSVDQFALTRAFVRDTKDDAHYIETDAMDPILDDVIAKLGFCAS